MLQFAYRDRREAGQDLAHRLVRYANRPDVVVLALPRGGVPVAYGVALALHAPLDVYGVRKLGVPGANELAMGAIASDGTCVADERVIAEFRVTPEQFERVREAELQELRRRELAYRNHRLEMQVAGKIAIVVDDGLATGATMTAAVRALRQCGAAEIVAAVPVGPAAACADVRRVADAVVCPYTPEPFRAVSLYYEDFAQVEDSEVRLLLELAEKAFERWQVA